MAILPPDPRYIFRGDMDCVHSILFRVDSNVEHLYAGTAIGSVYVWDLKANRELLRLPVDKDPCLSMESRGNNDLLIQHKCGYIKMYKIIESKWVLDKFFNTNFCNYCRFEVLSPSEILVPLKGSKIGVLSADTFELLHTLDPSKLPSSNKLGQAMVMKRVHNKDNIVLVGYEGGQLILWDVRQKRVLSSLAIEASPMALDFDVSSKKGIIGGPSEQLQVFHLSNNFSLHNKTKLTLKNPGTSILMIRPDSKILAAGGWDGRIRIFSWRSLRPLATLDQHRDTIHDIAYSPQKIEAYDNKCLMATAAKDGRIALWDIYN